MTLRLALRGLLALCAELVFAFLAVPAMARGSAAAGPERQILVMVRHAPDHYRPNGAYGGGYGDELARSARQRLARRIARNYGLTLVDDWPMPMMGLDCFVMEVPEDRTPASAVEQVSKDSAVSWAQPVGLYRTEAEPATHNDPLYLVQPAARAWHLADLHELATGRGMRVAVIDSGIDSGHPDLAGQLLVNRNFVAGRQSVAEMHGTGVAGIIAAKADNGLGIAGVAPQAHILGLRACWQSGRSFESPTVCDSFSLVKALYFAIDQKADVINLSLSGPEDRLIHELIDVGLSRGLAIVAAADKDRPNGGFPASVRGVIAVSNTLMARSQGAVYTAPGQDVPTTEPGGRWFLVNGSSYAAAHVSGLVALMRQRHPSSALALVSNGGAIDACASVLRAASGCECSCAPSRVATAQLDR